MKKTELKDQVLDRIENKPILWDAFYTADGEAKPLVIFCHGYKGFKDWGCWDLVAREFMRSGFCFVKFNFSHNGGTVAQPIDFPDLDAFADNNYSKELEDLDDLINFIVSNDSPIINEINPLQITLIGHSRGGGISIIKASEDSRINNLVTWASVSDFGARFGSDEEIQRWQRDGVKYVLNGRTKQQMPHKFQFYEDFIRNQKRLNIKLATERINIPHLIIHGKNDTSVSYHDAEQIHSWNSSSRLSLIDEADHVFCSKHPWTEDKMPTDLKTMVNASIEFII